jgi:hypothetical protein
MDAKGKDDSKIRQREEMLARRMGEALDRLNADGAGACPDAEVIAAYSDEALEPREMAQWEGHFAACDRCRKILRVLAAASEAPLAQQEVAELGAKIAAARNPVDIAQAKTALERPAAVRSRARWLAPALGVAAVLAVWFAMRPPWRGAEQNPSTTLIAQAPKDEIPPSLAPHENERLSANALAADRKVASEPPADQSNLKTAPLNSQPANSPVDALGEARADSARAKDSPAVGGAVGALQAEKKAKSLSEPQETPAFAASSSTTSAAPGPAVAPAPQPMSPSAGPQAIAPQSMAKAAPRKESADASQSAVNSNQAENSIRRDKQEMEGQRQDAQIAGGAVAQKAPGAPAINGRTSEALAVSRLAKSDFVVLKSATGSALWRGGKAGRIERSTDGGKTWMALGSPSTEDWLAGSAVSDTVCWLAGRHGALVRTIDGQTWQRVPPPVQAAGTDGSQPDWIALSARDAASATISAADGREFATTDGGQSWKPQP